MILTESVKILKVPSLPKVTKNVPDFLKSNNINNVMGLKISKDQIWIKFWNSRE